MSRWIIETRLAGDLEDPSDCLKAQHSAAMVFSSAGQSGEQAGVGTRILSAFMVSAAANAAGNSKALDGEVEHVQRVLGYMAKKLPKGVVRKDLEDAAAMNMGVLSSILASVAEIEKTAGSDEA